MIKTFHPSGSPKEVFDFMADSVRHGNYTRYDESGEVVETAHYKEGQLEGIRRLYEDGSVIILETYSSDVFHGEYKEYFPDGTVKLEGVYTDGELSGTVKGYYPSGGIKEEVTFVKNVENGRFVEYYDGGGISWEGRYLNGDKEFGVLKNYGKDGMLLKKMLCDSNAVCTTTWTHDRLQKKNND